MKKTGLKLLAVLPALLWYGVIWRLSAQTVTQSRGLSRRVLTFLLSHISPAYGAAEPEVQTAAVKAFTFYIRKSAHLSCYCFLSILLFSLLALWIKSIPRRCGVVLALCLSLAALDEYHQLFVPGRGGQLRDVFIDLSGSALALALCLLILGLWRTRRGNPLPALLMAGAACACAGLSFLLPQSLAGKVLGLSVRLAPIGTQVLSACLLVLAAGLAMLALVPLMGQRCRGMQRAD